jgi:hypothetical protein
MSNEVLIGIGGLILSVLTFFAGMWLTERRHGTQDREARIRRVFDTYMGFRRRLQTGSCDGLQKAGIATLRSNDEIEELMRLLVAHGEGNPWVLISTMTWTSIDYLRLRQSTRSTS